MKGSLITKKLRDIIVDEVNDMTKEMERQANIADITSLHISIDINKKMNPRTSVKVSMARLEDESFYIENGNIVKSAKES